jgi:hypothetical protein
MFAVHLLITIVAVVGSIYISNSFESMMNNGVLSTNIQAHVGSSWIILNLPLVTSILGILGLVIMLINFNKDPELKGTSI